MKSERAAEQVNTGEAGPAALSLSCVVFFMFMVAGASHLISIVGLTYYST